MKYFYKQAGLPQDRALLERIDAAAAQVQDKVARLDVNGLAISDYNKRYLKTYQNSLQSVLQRYAYLLAWTLDAPSVPLEQFVLVDYGGGSGIFSILAKALGVGTVIYHDIYDVSCQDARVVAQAIGQEAAHYVHGDLDELLTFLKQNGVSIHALASNDVLEHIYDVPGFFEKLSRLEGHYTILMMSGANNRNPLVRRKIMQEHLDYEYRTRQKVWGHKERDALKAYFDIRKAMITAYAPTLASEEVERLGKATRGLMEPEIGRVVDSYQKTGVISRQPTHASNTCDPYTGNWAEQLLDIGDLKKALGSFGFQVKILPGYYGGASRNAVKVMAGRALNLFIANLGGIGLMAAPAFAIYARKR